MFVTHVSIMSIMFGLLVLQVDAGVPFNETEYVKLQGSKARDLPMLIASIDLMTEAKVKKYFTQAVMDGQLELRGRIVLCIGARGGGEVRAFRDLGAFAVGVDLFPTNSNLVLHGDAMSLNQFGSSSVDLVFTNVLDHIPFLDRFAAAAWRVLKPGGMLVSSIFVQTMTDDKWSVRDTGTPAFFSMYDSLLHDAGFVNGARDPFRRGQKTRTQTFHIKHRSRRRTRSSSAN